MLNRPLDLAGLLELIWKEEWQVDDADPALDDYATAKDAILQAEFSTENFDQFIHILNPGRGLQMAASVATVVLPPVLTMIQLRRTLSDELEVNGTLVRIGAQIPPYRILTVELNMMKMQQT